MKSLRTRIESAKHPYGPVRKFEIEYTNKDGEEETVEMEARTEGGMTALQTVYDYAYSVLADKGPFKVFELFDKPKHPRRLKVADLYSNFKDLE
ncbi:hypothetical protein [Bacillus subtilis]|uniref:hypothetical protein n=1 Tax=Bacillus subtilis TaxID=1423 RepID=UPI001A94B437|nr:hypothetical protein [Bacillus subtilis]